MEPTNEFYSSLQTIYRHFNSTLFSAKLPPVIFTAQRQQSVMGHFAHERWASKAGKKCHEISINPAYVGRSAMIELLQTMVHEMAHCWQFCFGKPGRQGYHNKQWADKMKKIGLMPSDTGEPGGNPTGEHMSDYPLKGGPFLRHCETLLKDNRFELPWVDRYSRPTVTSTLETAGYEEALTDIDETIQGLLTSAVSTFFSPNAFAEPKAAPKKNKIRYSCPDCELNVWGKPGLRLSCDDCEQSLEEIMTLPFKL